MLLSLLFALSMAHARPLAITPTLEPAKLNFTFGWRSDLWSSPYSNKESPLRIYDSRLSAPFVEHNNWTLYFKGDIEGLSSGRADLVVGQNKTLIGSDLRSQYAGLGLTNIEDDGSGVSLNLTYNSDSDEPYNAARDKWVDFLGTYIFPAGANDVQWVVMLSQSKNRGYFNNRPVPMFGVIAHPFEGFTAILGFPFVKFIWDDFFTWRALGVLTPTGISGEVTRPVTPRTQFRMRGGLSTRSYLHVNRTEDDTRLFYQEQYVDSGIRVQVSGRTTMEVVFGKSYQRSFYEGKQIFDSVGPHENLDQDLYGRVRLEVQL